MEEHPQGKNPDGTSSSILHTYSTDLKTELKLSFVKETKKAKRYELGNKAVHVRKNRFLD